MKTIINGATRAAQRAWLRYDLLKWQEARDSLADSKADPAVIRGTDHEIAKRQRKLQVLSQRPVHPAPSKLSEFLDHPAACAFGILFALYALCAVAELTCYLFGVGAR